MRHPTPLVRDFVPTAQGLAQRLVPRRVHRFVDGLARRPPVRFDRGLVPRPSLWPGGLLSTRWEAGMSTTEYAVGTLAVAAFAATFHQVLSSGVVRDALRELVLRALQTSL